jgi:hypothetical protein
LGQACWLTLIISATQEAEIGRIGQKVSEIFQPVMLGVVVHTCYSSYLKGINRRTAVQGNQGKKHNILFGKKKKKKNLK